MSNIGRKVRINCRDIVFADKGDIGTITNDQKLPAYIEGVIEVKIDKTGELCHPYAPWDGRAECEWVDNLYNIDNIRDKKVIIEGATEEQYKQVLQVFENAGITWCSGDRATWCRYWRNNSISNNRIGYEGNDSKKLWAANIDTKADIVITATQFLQDNTNNNMDAQQQIDALKKQISQLEASLKMPVWKPKVGDWVVYDNGAPEKIAESRDDNMWVSASGRTMHIEPGRDKYRPATKEEVERATRAATVIVKIGSDNREVKVSKGKIEVAGRTLTIGIIEMLLNGMTWSVKVGEWAITTDYVNVGCCKQIKPSQLQEIVDQYNKLNT